MSEIVRICQDEVDITYFGVDYHPGCLNHLPWGGAQFDCIIFTYEGYEKQVMVELVDALLKRNNDWILIGGRDTEHWHDYIDQRSVGLGRQEAVGDGNPMSAWLEELTDLAQWDKSHNHGASDYFLFILVGCQNFDKTVQSLKHRIREI